MILTSLCLAFLSACSGYRFQKSHNPLAQYGISTLAIPMFYNRTPLPQAASAFTREMTLMLSSFRQLKVTLGEDEEADAWLIGIVEPTTKSLLRDTVATGNTIFTDRASLKDSIGVRNPFYLPLSSNITFSLRLVLIKKPSAEELALIKSDLVKYIVMGHPKILINQTMTLTGNFSRTVFGNSTLNEGGVVNFTHGKANGERVLETMAIKAADDFKSLVLYAF